MEQYFIVEKKDNWQRPASWPPLPDTTDDGLYFLMQFSSIYDIQFFGFRTSGAFSENCEIYINDILVYTGSGNYLEVPASLYAFDFNGTLFCNIKVVFLVADLTAGSNRGVLTRFTGNATMPTNIFGSNFRGANVVEMIYNTKKINVINNSGVNDYYNNSYIVTANVRHLIILQTSPFVAGLPFDLPVFEHLTGFENIHPNYFLKTVYPYFFGMGVFPTSGMPTTFDMPNLITMNNFFYSYLNCNLKSFPTLTVNTTTSFTSLGSLFSNARGLTGLKISNCTSVTTPQVISAINLTFLEMWNMNGSLNIASTAMWGTAIDNLVNTIADRTGLDARVLTLSERQKTSCNLVAIAAKNWTVI